MKELVNFSEYPADLKRFNSDWEEVGSFVRNVGLDGIELLIGSSQAGPPIPSGLAASVHLPGWFGWVRTWREPESIPADCSPHETAGYYGARTPEDLLDTFGNNLERASSLEAAYAVFHISHLELEEVYTRAFRYRSEEVLETAASFLNTLCSRYPNGEPPVTLAFENLWWPGLTFRSEEEVRFFADRLEFENWIFLLDTGHLMNGMDIRSEQEGIRRVLGTLESLSDETIRKIRAVHLQRSISGAYQKDYLECDPPSEFSLMSYPEKMTELMRHIPHIDEHRPFSDPSCREILDLIRPGWVVHEFITRSREELRSYIHRQRSVVSGT